MKQRLVKLKLVTAPDNLRRDGYALIAPIDEHGHIGMGAKTKWYPDGIYRLPGGGIDKNEGPAMSAVRELKEELNTDQNSEKLIPLIEIIINADTNEGNFIESFYCYAVKVKKGDVTAGDDLDGIKFMTKEEYLDLNSRFENMDIELKNTKWDIGHWKDYGVLFATIQKIVGEELSNNGLW